MKRQGQNIDWVHVKQRLKEAEQTLHLALHEDEAVREATFARRAVEMARRPASGESAARTDGGQVPVLTFRLADEHFALPLNEIVEVLSLAKCTALPAGPAEVVGVMSIAGELRSVLSLKRMLNLENQTNSTQGFVLLVRVAQREIAFSIDEVEKLTTVGRQQLSAPAEAAALIAKYASGRTSDGVPVLNPALLAQHPVLSESLQTPLTSSPRTARR
ncbi:MAG: chemotaxis protein CheW [Phycisphaeraceae bacterium]